jgi:metal-responsive CopG/Arc/MetJ family transcriptional regulator
MNTVISFSCPTHLAMRLNDEKIGSRKKSEWISDAIRKKLDDDGFIDIGKLDTLTIIAHLRRRDDIDDHLKEELNRRLNQ